MIKREVVVSNSLGIHARPASLIVQTAMPLECEVVIEKDGTSANAKSIMSVMMLAAGSGTKVTVSANGKDEQKAVDSICQLFDAKFNES